MRRRRFSLWAWILCGFAGLAVSNCGGENSAGPGSVCQATSDCISPLECRGRKCRSPLPKDPPIARALIAPEVAQVGTTLQLNASASKDPLGDALGLRYAWKVVDKPGDSKAKVERAEEVIASFVPDIAGKYTFEVSVSVDRSGEQKTAKAQASITVEEAPNASPTADAGRDQFVVPNLPAKLDGSKSSDPDGDKLTFAWSVQSGPDGHQGKFSDPAATKPEFTPNKEGKYILALVVTDTRGEKSSPDTVTLDVSVDADKTPKLQSITPTDGEAYETKYKVTLKGEGFVKGSRVRIGKPDFETKYISDTSLEAVVDLAQVGAGEHSVAVINTNSRASQEDVKFQVKKAPAPRLDSIDPPRGHLGQTKIVVTAKGRNFIKGRSEVVFLTVPLVTRVKSSTELEFDVNLRSTALGTYPVRVINPGNQSSNSLNFQVLDRLLKPVLRVLNPPSGVTGTRLTFSVHGQGFGKGAVIYLDGKPIPSVRRSRDEIAATPQLDLGKIPAGEYDMWVKNPDGQDSNKEKFRVREKDPAPKLSRILPFTLFLDEKSENVAIYGTDFLPGVRIELDGNEIKGAFGKVEWKSDTYVLASIDLTDTTKWKAGDVSAIAINPNGKKSNPFKISLSHRIPTIDGLIPGSWVTNCDTDVEVRGRNFLPRAVVKFGPNLVFSKTSKTNPLVYVDAQTLKFKLNTKTMTTGSYNVVIENGPIAKASTKFSLSAGTSPTPVPSYISPAFGRADTKVGISIQADFSNSTNLRSMKPGAVVMLGGKKHPTTCQTSVNYCYRLEASLDLTGYKPGIYDLVVVNPCGVKGPALSFVVEPPPLPFFSSVEPAFVRVGDKKKLVFKGGNFTKNHTLTWDGKVIKTVFKSGKQIETVDAIDFSSETVRTITVELKNANGKVAKTTFSILASFRPEITSVSNNVQSVGPLQDMVISGSGFVLTSAVFLDGKRVNSRFVSAKQIALRGLDSSGYTVGMHHLQVRNGSRHSNFFPIFFNSAGGPTINYLNPSGVVAGTKSTLQIYLYGRNFSQSPKPSTVIIKDTDNKDYSSNFKVSSMYTTFARGNLTVGALKQGRYLFQVKNPDGKLSNKIVFTISPPPPPVANSAVPGFGFRGNNIQQVQIRGSNFSPGDQIIFNNNLLNPIPGVVKSPTELNATLNLSRVKASRSYEIYVRRCFNPLCTKFVKTATVKFGVNDPPCSAIKCEKDLAPANSEKCDTGGGNVCRPVCKTTADCTGLDKLAKWTCQNGFCK